MATAKEKADALKIEISEQIEKAQSFISSLELNPDDYDLVVGLDELKVIVADLEAKQLEADEANNNDNDNDKPDEVVKEVDIQMAAKIATREAYQKNIAPTAPKEAVVQTVK